MRYRRQRSTCLRAQKLGCGGLNVCPVSTVLRRPSSADPAARRANGVLGTCRGLSSLRWGEASTAFPVMVVPADREDPQEVHPDAVEQRLGWIGQGVFDRRGEPSRVSCRSYIGDGSGCGVDR